MKFEMEVWYQRLLTQLNVELNEKWWKWLGHSKPPTPINLDEPKGHVQFKGSRLG
jgi:hypothetical protein